MSGHPLEEEPVTVNGKRNMSHFEEGVDADPTLSGRFRSGMRGWTVAATRPVATGTSPQEMIDMPERSPTTWHSV